MKPVSELILGNEGKIREKKQIAINDISLKSLAVKGMLYSFLLGILGIILMLLINLPLGLAIFGFILSLIFGQAFALMLYLWRIGKKSGVNMKEIFKKPFKDSRDNIIRQVFLGLTLAAILYLIIYSSIGLNYFGFVPSIIKAAWIPIYYIITSLVFIFYGLFFQMVIQSKFGNSFKNLCKLALLFFTFVFLYMFIYMLAISIVIQWFYYFGFIVPLIIPVFLLISFIWVFSYEKSGNIIVGALITAFFLTMMISTSAQLQSGLSFITGFLS
jgi:membrane protease YdiL (CAAX protease family)